MLLIRPTQALSKKLKVRVDAGVAPLNVAPMTEWYAREFRLGRGDLVLFTNPETCLSVVMKTAPIRTLAERFREYLPGYLQYLAWPDAPARLKPALDEGIQFLKTQDRSTTGIMNQLVFELECEYDLGRLDPEEAKKMNLRLAETPIGGARPGGYQMPIERFRDTLGIKSEHRRRDGLHLRVVR